MKKLTPEIKAAIRDFLEKNPGVLDKFYNDGSPVVYRVMRISPLHDNQTGELLRVTLYLSTKTYKTDRALTYWVLNKNCSIKQEEVDSYPFAPKLDDVLSEKEEVIASRGGIPLKNVVLIAIAATVLPWWVGVAGAICLVGFNALPNIRNE